MQFSFQTRVHLGFYAAYLQEWLSVFPRDQILVMRTEDYSANTTLLMRRVFDFLDLSSYIHMFCSSVSALNVLIIVNKTKNEARTSTSLSVNIINNKSSYVIFDCTLYAFLFRAFRRRGTEEIKYHDTKKGACYKIQTGEGTYDDKDQSNVG